MDPKFAEAYNNALKVWQYRPFMRCWIASKGREYQTVLAATAHKARRLARQGWDVSELKRN